MNICCDYVAAATCCNSQIFEGLHEALRLFATALHYKKVEYGSSH